MMRYHSFIGCFKKNRAGMLERHLTQTQGGMTPDSESAGCDLFAVQSDKTGWQKHFTGAIFDQNEASQAKRVLARRLCEWE